MEINQYVYRKHYISNNTKIIDFFWKKTKIIIEWIKIMKEKNIEINIEKLTEVWLAEFYILYKEFIKKKQNSKISNLIDIYTPRIENKENIYLWYIKEDWKLIWWAIYIEKYISWEKVLSLWYRAYQENFLINKLRLWYYLEYLFIEKWLSLHVDYLSRWKDRNWYGILWSNTWLALHKLQMKFIPYIKPYQTIMIDESIITKWEKEFLIFWWEISDQEVQSTKAILFTKHIPIDNNYQIIKKRWIDLLIKTIQS